MFNATEISTSFNASEVFSTPVTFSLNPLPEGAISKFVILTATKQMNSWHKEFSGKEIKTVLDAWMENNPTCVIISITQKSEQHNIGSGDNPNFRYITVIDSILLTYYQKNKT